MQFYEFDELGLNFGPSNDQFLSDCDCPDPRDKIGEEIEYNLK